MFNNHVYGIDLGSNMIKIYSQNSNEILKEKNMIAIRNKDTVLAVGDEAYEIYEKNPTNVKVSSPMLNGMIANISHLEIMLQLLLDKTERSVGRHPVIYFAVPVDMTEIEKRAYYSIAQTGRLRKSKVLLVERPIADALALGIPIMRTKGSMIVNIGAATTEISVIADSRVIISKVIPVGGDRLTQDIQNTIRRKLNFSISERTAGRLKLSLANLEKDTKDARKIIGIDCVSGLPRERVITSAAVNEAIVPAVREIITEIRAFLERIPPQIHRVILSEGIYLTGGSTHLAVHRPDSIQTNRLSDPAVTLLRTLHSLRTERDHHPRCASSLGVHSKKTEVRSCHEKKETIQNENKTSDHYDDNPVSRTDRPFSVHQFFFCTGAKCSGLCDRSFPEWY